MQPYHLADPTSYEAKLDALLFESYPDAQLPWRQGAGTKRAAPPKASDATAPWIWLLCNVN